MSTASEMAIQAIQKDSIPYYEHHAARLAAPGAGEPVDEAAIREFASRVRAPGRVLDAGCGLGRELAIFRRLGFQADGLEGSASLARIAEKSAPGATVRRGDLLFYSPQAEDRQAYDGVWAHQSLVHLNAVGWQRVLASFFLALKPGGILFVSAREGQGLEEDREGDPAGPARYFYLFGQSDLASLIRQHGFQLLGTGRNLDKKDRIAFIARRIQ